MSKIKILILSCILACGVLSVLAIDIPTAPKDPYAGLTPIELSKKGDEAYNAGRFDEAEKIYAALLKIIPDDPGANQRLQELKERRQQAEMEARRKEELAEKLKNAEYFLLKGDEAYKAGDYSTAVSYYIKVSEVDETYKDSGVKYWLSKGLEADGKSDGESFEEARTKIIGLSVPEALRGEVEKLNNLAEKYKPPENSLLIVTLESRVIIERFMLYIDGKMIWDASLSTWVGKKSSVEKAFSISPGNHIITLQVPMLYAVPTWQTKVNYSTQGGGQDSLLFKFPILGGVKIELNDKLIMGEE